MESLLSGANNLVMTNVKVNPMRVATTSRNKKRQRAPTRRSRNRPNKRKRRPFHQKTSEVVRQPNIQNGSSFSSNHSYRHPNTPLPATTEWPPEFYEHSNSYVFDSRSSMFYEARSGFFFEPVSRLYYGVTKQAYFQYNRAETPPFRLVEAAVDPGIITARAESASGNNSTLAEVPTSTARKHSQKTEHQHSKALSTSTSTAVSNNTNNNKIKIELYSRPHTKPSPCSSSSMSKQNIPREITSYPQASVISGSDASSSDNNSTSQSSPTRKNPVSVKQNKKQCDTSRSSSSSSREIITMTSDGRHAICIVCMRKFKTLDMLQLHTQKSQLHKDNLSKKRMKVQDSRYVTTAYSKISTSQG